MNDFLKGYTYASGYMSGEHEIGLCAGSSASGSYAAIRLLLLGKEGRMNKAELLRKLESLIDQMKTDRSFGQVAIAFRDGEPDFIRKEITEKVQGNSHAVKNYR